MRHYDSNQPDQAAPASPLAEPEVALGQTPGAYTEDLAWIVRQFSARVGASDVAVIVEYLDGRPAEMVFRDGGPLAPESAPCAGMDASVAEEEPLRLHLAQNEESRVFIQVAYPRQTQDAGDEEKRAAAQRLHPVLSGYFKLWLLHRSTSQRLQTIIAALAHVDFGVIVLDRDAMIVFENPLAAAILNEGSALHRCRGSVCGTRVAESVRLRVAIDHVLTNGDADAFIEGGSPVVLLKSPRQAPLVAAITPVVQPGPAGGDPAAVIHLFVPACSIDQMIAPICKWFKLSAGETRLVKMLVAGRSVQEMASAEGIKQDSVRTYLKSVFRKTDTRGQADLVRLMMTNPVRLRAIGSFAN